MPGKGAFLGVFTGDLLIGPAGVPVAVVLTVLELARRSFLAPVRRPATLIPSPPDLLPMIVCVYDNPPAPLLVPPREGPALLTPPSLSVDEYP